MAGPVPGSVQRFLYKVGYRVYPKGRAVVLEGSGKQVVHCGRGVRGEGALALAIVAGVVLSWKQGGVGGGREIAWGKSVVITDGSMGSG